MDVDVLLRVWQECWVDRWSASPGVVLTNTGIVTILINYSGEQVLSFELNPPLEYFTCVAFCTILDAGILDLLSFQGAPALILQHPPFTSNYRL